MQNRGIVLALCGLLVLSIVGCRVRPEVKSAVDRNIETANAALEKASQPGRSIVSDTVDFKDDIWLGDASFRVDAGDPLPAKFESDSGITLVTSSSINILEVADQINFLTGISVKVDDSLKSELSGLTVRDNPDEDKGDAKYSTRVAYAGPLSGLLDQVSSRMGIWWRYKNKTITFHDVETREFTIYTLPSQTTMSASVGGSISGADGGSASTNLSTSADVNFWAQIQEVVQSMLPANAKMVASQARGTITVSASPQTLRKVGKYVRELNEKLSRQVAISVKVLQVTLNDSDKYGLDLGAVFESNGLNVVYNGAYTATGGANFAGTGLGMSIVGATDGPMRHWNGSRAIIEALSTAGNVSVVTSSSITTLNNRVAPVQVGSERNYISEMSVQQNGSGVEPTVTTTTDKINSGFTMEILPRILDHGKLLIMFTMTISELVNLQEIQVGGTGTSSGTTLQLPEIETKGFVQEIAMSSGHTLALSGFEKVKSSYDMKGIGEASNTLLGGGINNSRDRSVLVVLITPEVLVSPLSPESRIASDM